MRNTIKNDDRLKDLGVLMIRLVLAAVFLYHGSQKLFGLFGGYGIAGTAGYFEKTLELPMPYLSAILVGLAEFLGGLSLLSGFVLRIAMIPLSFSMLVGAIAAHSGFNSMTGGMEYPLTLAVTTAALILLGPGRFAFRLGKSD